MSQFEKKSFVTSHITKRAFIFFLYLFTLSWVFAILMSQTSQYLTIGVKYLFQTKLDKVSFFPKVVRIILTTFLQN